MVEYWEEYTQLRSVKLPCIADLDYDLALSTVGQAYFRVSGPFSNEHAPSSTIYHLKLFTIVGLDRVIIDILPFTILLDLYY